MIAITNVPHITAAMPNFGSASSGDHFTSVKKLIPADRSAGTPFRKRNRPMAPISSSVMRPAAVASAR